jgi:hypothetical protein
MSSFFNGIDRYVLAALIAFQALVCYNFYSREIAWYPPANYDQAWYLVDAYRTKERVLTDGFGQLVRVIGGRHYTGLALPILGAVSGLCFGGGRLPVLLISFVGFSLLQVVAFLTGKAVWRSRTYGYMLLGLILCQITPWYWVGGLFDFRFDFIAYCFYGIWACAVIRSQLFLHRRWAVACGLIGAFLVLNRFLTLVYLFGVSAGFAVLCAAFVLQWRGESELRQRMSRRLYNLALSVGILVIIVTPFLIRSWREIFDYYGGHVLGDMKNARAHQMGLDGLAEHLLFYPKSLLRDNWGLTFVLGSAIVLISSLILGLTNSRKARAPSPGRRDETFVLQVIFLLGAVLGPIIVLTVDTDKSPVVSGVVGVPAALLVVAISAHAVAVRDREVPTIPRTVIACSLAIFALGVATVFDQLSRHLPEYSQRDDLMRLVGLNKWMVRYASAHGWRNPVISADVISPWFNGFGITDTGYEELGEFIEFHPLFSFDIMGADRQEALSQVAQSDFLILTTPTSREPGRDPSQTSPNSSSDANSQWSSILRRLNPFFKEAVQPPPSGISLEGSTAAIQRFPMFRNHLYPFYERLAHYRDDLKGWAGKNMILGQTVQFENFTVAVYVRPTETKPDRSGGALSRRDHLAGTN